MGNDFKAAYDTSMAGAMADKAMNSKNKELLLNFMRDADLDKFKRTINAKRRLRYINVFQQLEKWFGGKYLRDITAT